jgi:hypothetical protein
MLAELEGGSTGQAKRTLQTGQRLTQLPSTEEALRRGTLSGAKVAEIAEAATAEPDAEATLLAGSGTDPLHVVKERCQRVRSTSAARDPLATARRIHKDRYFHSWTDPEGAFCYRGRDSAEQGARLLAKLGPVANRLRDDRRAAAVDAAAKLPGGTPPPDPDSEAALRSDALFLLLGSQRSRSNSSGPPSSRPGPVGPRAADPVVEQGHGLTGTLPGLRDPSDPGDTAVADPPTIDGSDPALGGGPDELAAQAPPTTVMVRIDLEALRRGRVGPGEQCELYGHGPVPVAVVAGLIDDSFINLVFTEAGDIRAVSHLGRTINSRLRTALAFRDRCCVVPGCGVAYSLEIDHVVPMELGGPTELDNLALLCRHHHRMKTYDGWELSRNGPSDADPGWTFTPLPPFGQEPDLGSRNPREPVPRI